MQATQPLRTYQLKAGITAFAAAAILVTVLIAASLAPYLGLGSGAGTNAGSGIRIPRDDWANAAANSPLKLDADAGRRAGRGVHVNIPN
jgi:hypothetical protein